MAMIVEVRKIRFDNSAPGLRAVTPLALAAYARSEGWEWDGPRGPYADAFVREGKTDLVAPHTDTIDDYPRVVEDFIVKIADALGKEECQVYRDLTEADRDVIWARAREDGPDGLPFESGHALLAGARTLLIAAAHSLDDNRPVLPAGPSPAVVKYLNRLRMRHTEASGFGVMVTSPAILPRLRPDRPDDEAYKPMERRVGERLSQSLFAVRDALQCAVRGEAGAFDGSNAAGVSANLCEAVAGMVEGVGVFDISFTWALTRASEARRGPASFAHGDVGLLREAARELRRVKTGRHPGAPLVKGQGRPIE